MGLAAKVIDARGRKVRLLPPVGPRELREASADGRAALIQDAWMSSISFGREVIINTLVLVSGAALGGVLIGKHLLPEWAHGVLVGMALTYAMWAFWRMRRRAAPIFAKNLVERGLCASCAYPIREVGADSDGVRTCPECGSAWRMS